MGRTGARASRLRVRAACACEPPARASRLRERRLRSTRADYPKRSSEAVAHHEDRGVIMLADRCTGSDGVAPRGETRSERRARGETGRRPASASAAETLLTRRSCTTTRICHSRPENCRLSPTAETTYPHPTRLERAQLQRCNAGESLRHLKARTARKLQPRTVDDPLIYCSSIHFHLSFPLFLQTHQVDDPLISTVPPFICSNSPSGQPSLISLFLHSFAPNSPSRRPSDICCSSILKLTNRRPSDIHLDNRLISAVPPFICSNSPSRRPSDIPCSSIHLLKLTKDRLTPLIRPSAVPPFIKLCRRTSDIHSFAQTHQVDNRLISCPFICSNSPSRRPSDIHCSSIHLLKLTKRPSDIPCFLHSFAQTHQVDDPLISTVPPFICSNSPSRRPSDIPCSSIHFAPNSPSRRPSDIPVPPFICSNSPNRRPLISTVPPFICSNSPKRPSDIHCSSIHLLKLTNDDPLISTVPPFICSKSTPSHQDDPLISLFLHSFAQTHQVDDPLISTVPPFICSNSPNRRPSDIHLDDPLISTVPPFICSNSPSRRPLNPLFLHSFAQTHQIDDPLISTVPPFICSNSPNRRPSDIPVPPFICSNSPNRRQPLISTVPPFAQNSPNRRPSDIHYDLLISTVPPFICSNSPSSTTPHLISTVPPSSFAQTHQVDDPLISTVPPFICSNSPNRRPSDIHCSSIHFQTHQVDDLLISTVPPFICSNSPNRRPSDIHCFLHSFAQTHQVDDLLISTVPPFICSNSHQVDDPLISTVPPFICSNSPNRRPSDIHCSSIHLLKLTK
ncbi:unnamed protein product [Acanthosepion pharaonis]|uniref:Uncharacterized protein n=1 Tax=Acanthosepion pharaonis TaxID=158019 RepID=A0A812BAK0_ACAPH|nr:unnamed protein product [Sepia pharaonis]